MSDHEFDVIVIGGGPAGEVLAGRLTEKSDKQVALVEGHLLGGECSYYACMPSKALLRPQEVLREVGRVPGAREALGDGLDVQSVLDRRDRVVHGLDDSGQVDWVESRRIELFRGYGRLDGERSVRVGDQTLVARDAVVIAVGTSTMMPPIPGLDEVGAWGNHEVTLATEAPDRLVILGGGVVGVEMAQAWRSLGSEVVLVELGERLLGGEEPFVGAELQEAFDEQGIEVRSGSEAVGAERKDGQVVLHLDGGESVTGDQLLVAVGRRPLTDDLGLDSVGLEPGGYLEVDEALRVKGNDWLYAIGDVNGRALLTHMGKYQARLLADRIALGGDEHIDSHWDAVLRPGGPVAGTPAHGPASPRVVFTDPQVAAVGHTLASAQEHDLNVTAIDIPTSGNAGASFYGRGASGTTRFVVDVDRDTLIGATFVGPEVADFLHAATVAIVGEVPIRTLVHAVPSFPTRSEVWLKFIEAYGY